MLMKNEYSFVQKPGVRVDFWVCKREVLFFCNFVFFSVKHINSLTVRQSQNACAVFVHWNFY